MSDETPAVHRPRSCLWLIAELPEVCATGKLTYSDGLARSLAEAGWNVEMLGLGRSNQGRGRVAWTPVDGGMDPSWRSAFSTLPNVARSCATGPMQAAFRSRLGARSWDVVILDHLQVGWAAPFLSDAGFTGVAVFVTHNHETSVRRDVARAHPPWHPLGLVLRADAWKAARLEGQTLASSQIVTAITEADAARFSIDSREVEVQCLPPGYEPPTGAFPGAASRPRRVGIFGSFEWHAKERNLQRFIEAADPIFAANGIELVVGGMARPAFVAAMRSQAQATRFDGWVADAGAFLRSCRVGVVAEPLGGGFKLKSLDYVFHRVAVGWLTGSVEGVPIAGASIEAPDEAALAAAIVGVIDDATALDEFTAEALARCGNMYSWRARGERFAEVLSRARLS